MKDKLIKPIPKQFMELFKFNFDRKSIFDGFKVNTYTIDINSDSATVTINGEKRKYDFFPKGTPHVVFKDEKPKINKSENEPDFNKVSTPKVSNLSYKKYKGK